MTIKEFRDGAVSVDVQGWLIPVGYCTNKTSLKALIVNLGSEKRISQDTATQLIQNLGLVNV